MPCYHPLTAYQRPAGGPLLFGLMPTGGRQLSVPCGRCVGCRLEYSRQWGVRCMHEAKMHDENSFLTLTYNDDSVPADLGLCPKHFTDFFKRLRERERYRWCGAAEFGPPRFVWRDFRYFMCGEYGELNSRPHYHCALFGFYPSDAVFYKTAASGFPVYTSKFLRDLWGHGEVYVGQLTFESAAYVARYVMKKVGSDGERREIWDLTTGEIITRPHEFCRMSRRPGIGSSFVAKYGRDIFMNDRVVTNGHAAVLPRFYDSLMERHSPLLLAEHKAQRRFRNEVREQRVAELHPELAIGSRKRLLVEEKVKLASIQSLRRE